MHSLSLKYAALIALVLVSAAALRHWDPPATQRVRAIAFDTYQQLSPRRFDPATRVRIVDIDEASLAARGQWPWPRTDLARLVSRLDEMGAVAIVFDMVFPEPDRLSPEEIAKRLAGDPALSDATKILAAAATNDQKFADAIARSGVVMGFAGAPDGHAGSSPPLAAEVEYRGHNPKLFVPAFPHAVVNLPLLSTKAAGSGFINWIAEQDQVIRKLPLLIRVGDQLYPSIAAEGLRVAQGISNYLIVGSGADRERSFGAKTGLSKVLIGNAAIPTDAAGQMWLRFTHTDRRRYISANDVLEGTTPADEVNGRIIVIGTSAAGLLDIRATPLDASIPGVEAHAQAIEQMLAGDYLERPDFATGGEIIMTWAMGVLLAWAVYRSGAMVGLAVGALAVLSVLAASWLAFSRLGWLLDPIYSSFTLTAVYLAGTSYLRLVIEQERNRSREKLRRIAQEMESAAQIQRSFLPRDVITETDRCDVFAVMTPAKDVGGDFYDYFMINETKLAFAVGDVSGKGVPAALFMSVSRTVLRTVAFEADAPGAVLSRVNSILARDNNEGMFVTLFYAVLDLSTGNVAYSSAGHDDALLLSGTNGVQPLHYMGPAIGLFDGVEYPTEVRPLAAGDSLFLLTDGVTEAFNIDGRVFTPERLIRLLGSSDRSGARSIVETVTREVAMFSAGTEQSDDITCIAVQFRNRSAGIPA